MTYSGRLIASVAVGILLTAACGNDPTDPTEVTFGETTILVVVNPALNTANDVATIPTPGTTRSGITVSVDGGPSATTGTDGVVVLAPVDAGTHTITLSGGGLSGTVNVSIADQDLREVAVALTTTGAALMADVRYAFGGQVVNVTPSMTLAEVNDALSQSNTIVFFGNGTYTGDLAFSGSNVTLFGAGTQGGQVTLNGNVTIDGSANRMRGARVTGSLDIPGSNVGLSFSRVAGALTLDGSSGVLLNNGFCGTATISGSGTTLIGNAGLAPVAAPTSC